MPEICSSLLRCSSTTCSASACVASTLFWDSASAFSLRACSSSRRSCWASLRSRFSSFWTTRFSRAATSWRRAWIVLSNSARAARTFSLASIEASRSFASAPRLASARTRSASVRMFLRSSWSFFLRKTYATTEIAAARTKPAAIAIARSVFISAPPYPGARRSHAAGYTMMRKSFSRRGFAISNSRALKPTTRYPSCPIVSVSRRRAFRRPGRRPVFESDAPPAQPRRSDCPFAVSPSGVDRPICSAPREWQFLSYRRLPFSRLLLSSVNQRSGQGRECRCCHLRPGRCTSVRRSPPESRFPFVPIEKLTPFRRAV